MHCNFLIFSRRAWDIFLYPRGRGGTRIPLGPVLPPRPSAGWEKFLKKKRPKKVIDPRNDASTDVAEQ